LRSEAFPRRVRLPGGAAFNLVLASRRICRSERFLVQARANGGSFGRLGVVVGKRVAPLAVDRNFLKRLVRETFRRHWQEVAGFDLLVRPRRSLSSSELNEARKDLHALLIAVVR
jgi:ribonuclease P protein component